MANTYELISAITVGSGGASSLTFSSIPSTYTDLVLKCSLREDTANYAQNLKIVINGSTSTIYSDVLVYGNGSATAYSAKQTNEAAASYQYSVGATATASIFGNGEFYFTNYTLSQPKSYSYDGITENNATNCQLALNGGVWNNTAAITSLQLISEAAGKTFYQHSTAYLYGIKKS